MFPKEEFIKKEGVSHYVLPNHIGMTCHICQSKPAAHKLYEDSDEAVLLYEENGVQKTIMRHPLTAYACCSCFKHVMGPIVGCGG